MKNENERFSPWRSGPEPWVRSMQGSASHTADGALPSTPTLSQTEPLTAHLVHVYQRHGNVPPNDHHHRATAVVHTCKQEMQSGPRNSIPTVFSVLGTNLIQTAYRSVGDWKPEAQGLHISSLHISFLHCVENTASSRFLAPPGVRTAALLRHGLSRRWVRERPRSGCGAKVFFQISFC